MLFSGEKSPWHWSRAKSTFHSCPSIEGTVNSELEIYKISQNTTTEALVHAHIYLYITTESEEANSESNTFL